MRKLVKRSLAFCLLLSMLFSMAKPALAAGGIKQKQLSLYTGQSAQLTLTGVKGKATWTTSNKKVATVSAAGNVKGVAKGNATITAKVGKASYQCKVTVKDPSISAASKTLTKGGKFTLSLNGTKIKAVATSNNKVATVAKTGVVKAVGAGQAKITLTGTNNKKYVCTVTVVGISQSSMKLAKGRSQALRIFGRTIKAAASSNAKVATVTNQGVVKAVGVGKATITLTGNDKKKYTCVVTVTGINRSTLKLTKGSTFTLSLSNTSISAAATTNSKVATVTKKGVVKAVGVGKATITLTDTDKKKYTCAVTVTTPPFVAVSSITVLAGDREMTVGDSQTLKTVIAPNNATNKALTWSSSDVSVATVSQSGEVRALAVGEATITATAKDGKGASGSVKVTVKPVLVQSVTFARESEELYPDETLTLIPDISPNSATNKALTWSSSDVSVATVSRSGEVRALAVGETVITAAAQDGSGASGSVKVIVHPVPVSGITLNQDSAALYPTETVQLTAQVTPENATNQVLAWSSSDPTLASVDNTGLVTALLPGTVVITAAATDGSGVSASCQVTVESTSVIVGSLTELAEAAANGNIKEIVLASNTTGRITIPEGRYEDKELTVDVPNGEVENNARWKQITIQAISADTYIENAQGNTILFAAPSGTLTLTQRAQAVISVVGDTGSARSLTVIDNSSADLLNRLQLLTPANLTITGDNNNLVEVDVDEGAQGSQVETTKKVSMTVRATGVRLIVESGGEDSNVTASTVGTVPEIQGQGRIPVRIADSSIEKIVVAGNNGSGPQSSVELTGSVSVDGASVYLLPYDSTLSSANAGERLAEMEPAATVTDGSFSIPGQSYGNYSLAVLAENYIPVVNTVILTSAVTDGSIYQMPEIVLISLEAQQEANGTVSGTVIDSVTGKAITSPVTLNLRSGLNNMSGPVLQVCQVTDGTYCFQGLASGYYSIQAQTASQDAPITSSSVNVTVISGRDATKNLTVTRTIEMGQVQFVLHWNTESANPYVPADLDSHLVGPAPDGGSFHIYYYDRTCIDDGVRYADLDVDDTSYEGPETTTIYKSVDGIYRFYVYDFTNQENEQSNKMSDFSGAHVEIKSNSSVVQDVVIPTGSSGNLWHVADYDSRIGRFMVVNTVGYWPDNGSDTVGMSVQEVLRASLRSKAETLETMCGRLLDNQFKTSVTEALQQANALLSGEASAEQLQSAIQTVDGFLTQIRNAFHVDVEGSDLTDIDVNNEEGTIMLEGCGVEAPAFTVTAYNNDGQQVSVEQTAVTEEDGCIALANVTNTESGVAQQFRIYYQRDLDKLFGISEVTGTGITGWNTGFSVDDEDNKVWYMEISGTTEDIPDDLAVTPDSEEATAAIDRSGAKPVVTLCNGADTRTYELRYTRNLKAVFAISDVTGTGIAYWDSDFDYDDNDELFWYIDVFGTTEGIPDDFTVQPELAGTTAEVDRSGAKPVVILRNGADKRTFEIHFTREQNNLFRIEEVTGTDISDWVTGFDSENDIWYLSLTGIGTGIPDNLEVTPKAEGTTAEIDRSGAKPVVILRNGADTCTYEIRFRFNLDVFRLDDVNGPVASSRIVLNDPGPGVILLAGAAATLAEVENLEFTCSLGSSTAVLDLEQHPDDCDGVCTVTYQDQYTYQYKVLYQPLSSGAALTLNESMDVVIAKDGWQILSFTPEQSGTYNLRAYQCNKDTYADLFDANGKWVTSDDDDGEGCNFSLSYALEAGHTYFYIVRDINGGAVNMKVLLTMGDLDEIAEEYDDDSADDAAAAAPEVTQEPAQEVETNPAPETTVEEAEAVSAQPEEEKPLEEVEAVPEGSADTALMDASAEEDVTSQDLEVSPEE